MEDAVIIGGGLAGSTLALRLAAAGWNTVLVDRQSFPRHKACGEFLSPETREIFDELGLRCKLEALGPSSIHTARLIFRHGGSAEAGLEEPAWGLSRCEMDKVILQAAEEAGVQVLTETTAAQIEQNPSSSEYHIRIRRHGRSEEITARTVFAAWGIHAPKSLSPASAESEEGSRRAKQAYIGLKAHFTGIPITEAVELYFIRGGYVGLSSIENGRTNVAALLPLDHVRGKGKSVGEMLTAISRGNRKLAARLAEGRLLPETQVSAAPVYLSSEPQAWTDFPHVGDAGTMIPPLFGDGMSAALRSAKICAAYGDRYLRGELSTEAWRDAYQADMDKEYTSVLRWGHRLQTLATMPVLPRIWTAGAKLFPPLASYAVKATRLNQRSQV